MNQTTTLQTGTIAEKTVGAFVAEDYRTAEVFEKYGIDFCCGGQVPLAAACREQGLDQAALERELAETKRTPLEKEQDFAAWDLPELADHIVAEHHGYLKENTAQIATYARKIAEVHGKRHPEVIEIATIFDRVAAAMTAHLEEEEEILFPAVKRIEAARGAGATPEAQDRETIAEALRTLDREHQEIGDAVHAIRRLAKDYEIPQDVCNTFAVTYRKLKEFEDDLHKHVHLENNILFPQAARL